MPNNKKKNRKGKGRKKTDGVSASMTTTTSTAARAVPSSSDETAAVAIPSFLSHCDNPSSCNKCLFAFPTGCLHSLRDDERYSPVMFQTIPVFQSNLQNGGEPASLFWGRPENARFATEATVRFFFYMAVKVCLLKNSFADSHVEMNYQYLARVCLNKMMVVHAIIKCGSNEAAKKVLGGKVALLDNCDQRQVSCLALFEALMDIFHTGHCGLVYTLNELSPCNCLESEVKRARQEAKEQVEEEAAQRDSEQVRRKTRLLLDCSNLCGEREESDENVYSCCSRCKLAVYCSRQCQEGHWEGRPMERTMAHALPHKHACKAIRELKAFLADGHSSMGEHATRAARGDEAS